MIYNLSASIFLLTISTILIIGVFQVPRLMQVTGTNIQEIIKYQKNTNEASLKTQNELQESISNFLNASSGFISETTNHNKSLQLKAINMSKIIEDIMLYYLAKSLENLDVLSPTDANLIAISAIENITSKSERWGKIAKALNDLMLKDQRQVN